MLAAARVGIRAIGNLLKLRLSRQSVEVVIAGTSKARVSRQSVETVIAGTSASRLSRQSVETVIKGTSATRLSRQSNEVVIVGTSKARLSRQSAEVVIQNNSQMAQQAGTGSADATGGGFCGGMRLQFTPTVNFTVTGLAWASGVESAGSPVRVVRILDASGNELVRSAYSSTSFRGADDYTPAAPLNLTSPFAVTAGTTYWADAIVTGPYGTGGYINRRQTGHLVSSGLATIGTTQRVNGSVAPEQGFSWNSPSGPVFTNQDNSSNTAYERVIIYGY